MASAALAASSVFVFVQPASGALVTRCTGEAGAVTVPGRLVVPSGADCMLVGTTVLGDIRVAQDADLLLDGAVVGGQIRVVRNGYLDAFGGTSVAGDVEGRNAYGIFFDDATIGGSVYQSRPNPTDQEPFLYLFSTGVAGGLDSSAGEVLIESSQVQGDVSARSGEYADVVDSVLGGGLVVQGNAFGSVVCESEVYGDAVFGGNQGTLQIGGGEVLSPCDGASFWGGDVTFVDNAAGEGFDISNNIVAGDLVGSGNEPAPTGAGNRVRGEITLPFADPEAGTMSLQELSGASLESQAAAEVVVEDRTAELVARAEARAAEAAAGAAATPEGEALSPAPAG